MILNLTDDETIVLVCLIHLGLLAYRSYDLDSLDRHTVRILDSHTQATFDALSDKIAKL